MVNFSQGSMNNSMECINVTIVDDDNFEVNQSFTIEITGTSDNDLQVGPDDSTTVFIIDDDRK